METKNLDLLPLDLSIRKTHSKNPIKQFLGTDSDKQVTAFLMTLSKAFNEISQLAQKKAEEAKARFEESNQIPFS